MLDSNNFLQQGTKDFGAEFDLSKKAKFENKNIILYSCSLIQNAGGKIHYLKIFDNFLMLSKVK